MYIRIVKNLLLLILFMLTLPVFSQTWQSISRFGTYENPPYFQFEIDPYTNNLWLVSGYGVSVIEGDGDILIFEPSVDDPFDSQLEVKFAFTPGHTYYAPRYGWGLRSFDNYTSQSVYVFADYNGELRYDGDTVFIVRADLGGYNRLVKYTESGTSLVNHNASNMIFKNGFHYADNGDNLNIYYYPDVSSTSSISIQNDVDYLGGEFNYWTFSRNTDTLYVSCNQGISIAYAYDFLDTITPYNSFNMPSSNVLEMEFDHNDSLWAVFGDNNDDPFAIAKLEGNTWINIYDSGNSPIDFTTFLGLEIDTLGNLWVADENAVHTLLGPNSPGWLSTTELSNPEKELIGTFDLLGRPAEPKTNTLLIYQYSDGTTEKKILVE